MMNELRLRRGREICGLTLGQASQLLGIPVARLSESELGRLTLDEHELRAIGVAYQTTVAWLLGDAPHVPEATRTLLRDHEISPHDRDLLLETVGMWSTPEEG